MKQVNKDHYTFENYLLPDRWASYYFQIKELLSLRPESVLEVGTGDGFLKNYLISNTSINYRNLDVAEDLNPDIIGSVESIPLPDDSVDVVCAFEVLEHLPFEKFETSLLEMRRVAKRYVVISLPHFGPPVKFSFKFPLFKEVRIAFKIPYSRAHTFNGEHYWEIGKRGYGARKIRGIIGKYFNIKREFIPFDNQYHHFYILEK